MANETSVTISGRLSYLNAWEPRAPKGTTDARYSVQILIPKTDKKMLALIDAAIEAAEKEGEAKIKNTPVSKRKMPFKDGAVEFPNDPFYKDFWIVNANNKKAPGIKKKVNGQVVDIVDQDELYSGCWGHVLVNFFAYNNVGVGIGASLQHILKWKNDERLDGRISAEAAFGSVDYGDTEEGNAPPVKETRRSRFDD